MAHDLHPEELLEKLERMLPQFEGIAKVAPLHDSTIHGERIPREPHRYSGRTAMHGQSECKRAKTIGG